MLREGLDFFGVTERWDDLEFDLSLSILGGAEGDGARLWNGMGAGDLSGETEDDDIRFVLAGDFLSLFVFAGEREESEESEERDEREYLCRFFLSFWGGFCLTGALLLRSETGVGEDASFFLP